MGPVPMEVAIGWWALYCVGHSRRRTAFFDGCEDEDEGGHWQSGR
jgi:hypothetical protein